MGTMIVTPMPIVRIRLARTRVRAWLATGAMDALVKVRVYTVLLRAVTQLVGYMENTAFDLWLYTLLGDAPVRNYWSVSIGILFAALGKVAILCDLVNRR